LVLPRGDGDRADHALRIIRAAGVDRAAVPVLARGEGQLVALRPLEPFVLFAATARSLLPLLAREGIVTAEILNGDTLAARSRAEVIETGVSLMFLPVVTAWARKPLVV
jgi:hypothetical protein